MKEKLAILSFSSNTLLIENYSQNQWNYLQNQCLKHDLTKKQPKSSKTRKDFFPVILKAPFLAITK